MTAESAASVDAAEPAVDAASVELCVVFVNTPENFASRIARLVVEARLAACVNIVPQVKSVYRWQGKIEEESESTLIMKTRLALVPALTEAIKSAHPYSVPEVLAVPVIQNLGNLAYHAWVVSET